jgi:hypothetical protein
MRVNKKYPATECAKDMQAGLAHMGGTGDAVVDASLERGRIIMMPCPACAFEGRRQHMLTVEKRGGKFVVA